MKSISRNLLFPLLGWASLAFGQPAPSITVTAAAYDRVGTPVFFLTPPEFSNYTVFELTDPAGNVAPAQRWNRDSAVFVPDAPLPAGATRTYRLRAAAWTPPARVTIRQDSGRVAIAVAGKPVMVYHAAAVDPPAGEPAFYRASGYVHPLYSPGGAVLTDDFPVDHRHQHGVFLTWVNTTYRGAFTDFWNQQGQTGTTRHVAVLDTVSGPVFARLRVRIEHVSLAHGPALVEERTFVVYNRAAPFLIDLFSEQRTTGADTLFLNQYHYGGMAFRGSARWNAADSTAYRDSMHILTGEGRIRYESNHTRPRWVAGYGDLEGAPAGVVVLDHPGNFRFPQPVRVHPDMPYFCFAPMVMGPFAIVPGQTYRSRYRLLTFDGPPLPALVEQWWAGQVGDR